MKNIYTALSLAIITLSFSNSAHSAEKKFLMQCNIDGPVKEVILDFDASLKNWPVINCYENTKNGKSYGTIRSPSFKLILRDSDISFSGYQGAHSVKFNRPDCAGEVNWRAQEEKRIRAINDNTKYGVSIFLDFQGSELDSLVINSDNGDSSCTARAE